MWTLLEAVAEAIRKTIPNAVAAGVRFALRQIVAH
jgi:hypothetical protein